MRELKTRTVVLLGRRPPSMWDELRTVLHRNDDLVVLSLGYPVSEEQRSWLLAAQELAAEIGAWFDALLVVSPRELVTHLLPGDDVRVAASGREARRLQSAAGAVER